MLNSYKTNIHIVFSNSFRSITTIKYYIQIGLDALEESRKILLDRLLEIDQTMENPREEDVARVRYCKKCNSNFDGPACTHCELDEIFQVRNFHNLSHFTISIMAALLLAS